MKNKFSFIACCLAGVILLSFRIWHSELIQDKPLKVTTWDAFGYYFYLPSIFIYHDITKLDWLPEIDNKYALKVANCMKLINIKMETT